MTGMETDSDDGTAGGFRPAMADPAWLTATFAKHGRDWPVAAVAFVPVGTGQLGDTVRLTIRYADAARSGPPTIIGKFATTDPTGWETATSRDLYEREVRFYLEIARRSAVRTPACYGAEAFPDGSMAVLLEDLGDSRPGDQFKGLTEAEARNAMVQAAGLHATLWGKEHDPAATWLDAGNDAQPFYPPEVFRAVWPPFRDRFAARLTADHVRICDGFAEHNDNYSRLLDRPRCVTHNDYRPDNMMFDADGSLYVVDWATSALGVGAIDIAYLIGGAFEPAARDEAEAPLLDAYCSALAKFGVSGYSRADLDHDYRHFSFAGVNVAVGAAMLVKRTERGDELFLTMLDRHVRHVIDCHALDLIAGRS